MGGTNFPTRKSSSMISRMKFFTSGAFAPAPSAFTVVCSSMGPSKSFYSHRNSPRDLLDPEYIQNIIEARPDAHSRDGKPGEMDKLAVFDSARGCRAMQRGFVLLFRRVRQDRDLPDVRVQMRGRFRLPALLDDARIGGDSVTKEIRALLEKILDERHPFSHRNDNLLEVLVAEPLASTGDVPE